MKRRFLIRLCMRKDGRKDDIKGDSDKLASDDPKDLRASELEGEDEEGGATPKH